MYKKIGILIVLLTILLTIFVSCSINTSNTLLPMDNSSVQQISDGDIEKSNQNSVQQITEEKEITDENKVRIMQKVFDEGVEEGIFGVWSLDKIVLESENYSGEYRWNGRIYNRKNYIGYEVEYSPDFFRLGKDVYINPEYQVWDSIFYDYNINGGFLKPDLYDLIITENISVDRSDEFENIDDVPLKYFIIWIEKEKEDDVYIPVGT